MPGPVVEGDDEVEEVGLAEVGRRLLLEVGSTDAWSNAEAKVPRMEVNTGFKSGQFLLTIAQLKVSTYK